MNKSKNYLKLNLFLQNNQFYKQLKVEFKMDELKI